MCLIRPQLHDRQCKLNVLDLFLAAGERLYGSCFRVGDPKSLLTFSDICGSYLSQEPDSAIYRA